MQLTEAIELISHDQLVTSQASVWADLGCGHGLFTKALTRFLQPGSHIYAVDIDESTLPAASETGPVAIRPLRLDFAQDDWPFPPLDGLLMANSLHYVSDKRTFLQKAIRHLTASGRFLIVEYDTDQGNPWVPFPASFRSLSQLFEEAGFASIQKLHERPSRYGKANLYAAFISRG
ncbi:class I SAM-dependent methyltransferase [Fibrisoma montanum]|uniref:Class I SAM-dependent methyltransferase n=1 Tax=Fibrisoma montanum TaxID=2305895 RepID=A0A418M202_9BACT|nr:class I SAM-dependent methyltransferase [Fibrisoma montanum]RIV19772.1 class I SAM-dependent methyltransferase [Fibrisoma montanum]